VVTTNIEHPAITQCLHSYAQGGLTPKITVSYVPVNNEGIVSTQDVMNAIQPNTALVTVMTANNEVGSIQPVLELASKCREKNVLFHTDSAQAVGKIDLRGLANDADMITLVGHKFGAPKGIAALYIRPKCIRENESVLLMGGGQENGRRGGTENVPYIVGMGRAAELLLEQRETEDGGVIDRWQFNAHHMERMRDRLLENIANGLQNCTEVRVNGPSDSKNRLPNTLSIGFKGIQSGVLLSNIGNSVACSAGSACHSSSSVSACEYSAILKAMNVPPEYGFGTLRLSVGPDTTEEDVDFAAAVIVEDARRKLDCK
jgi:cysteine desulfurase